MSHRGWVRYYSALACAGGLLAGWAGSWLSLVPLACSACCVRAAWWHAERADWW